MRSSRYTAGAADAACAAATGVATVSDLTGAAASAFDAFIQTGLTAFPCSSGASRVRVECVHPDTPRAPPTQLAQLLQELRPYPASPAQPRRRSMRSFRPASPHSPVAAARAASGYNAFIQTHHGHRRRSLRSCYRGGFSGGAMVRSASPVAAPEAVLSNMHHTSASEAASARSRRKCARYSAPYAS
jgi:hypothetical protein